MTGAMVASVALSIASQARADIYEYNPSGNITEGAVITIDGHSDGLQSGGIGLKDLTPGGSDLTALCLDVSGGINTLVAGQLYVPVPFPGTGGLNPPWGNNGANSPAGDPVGAIHAIQNAAEIYFLNGGSAGTSTEKWSAMQLAIWETLYDTTAAGINVNGLNPPNPLGTGRFRVNSTQSVNTAGDAAGEVQGLTGNYGFPGFILVPVDSHGNPLDSFQEFLFGITPLPEPTTLIAGALLLLPFGASTVRFMRKNRQA